MRTLGAERPPLAELYDRRGPQDGPAVLLVHGALLDRRTWAPQDGLADRFCLLAPDLPWHGRHRPGAGRQSLDGCARFLLEVLDHAGREEAAVVGFSYGGLVAQRLAELAPQRVRRLILYACPLLAHLRVPAPRLMARLAAAQTLLKPWPAIREAFAAKCADPGPGRADVMRASAALGARDYRDIFHAMALGVRFEPDHRLGTASAYLYGTEDVRLTDVPAIARRYRDLEPDGVVVPLPGASHCAHWEAAEAFNQAIIALAA